jgi:HAD superfamily hydrolase (TIGR01549 family)
MAGMTYDTVVFDNDGVLVGRTSFDVLREATQETFEQFGVTDPDPDHVEDMTIGATPGSVGHVCDTYDLEPDSFWRTRDRTLSLAQQQEAHAGRKTPYDDLDTLADLDVSMGVVSSNQQETVDFLLDHFDVSHLFGTAYGREPTVESLDLRKPHPHYVDRALADLDADSALFVGDNESDVRAAENAGIDSAFIRRPHRDDWDLNVWPTWDIDCLDDLHDICSA